MLRSVKRRYGRAPICCEGTFTVRTVKGAERVGGTIWQIGEGGLFVELPTNMFIPESLAVSFDVPGFGTHRVLVSPKWHTDKPIRAVPGAASGSGCEFSDVSSQTREAVAAYVKRMKATYSSLQFALALDRPTPQLPQLLKETHLEILNDRRLIKERVAQVVAQLQPSPL